MSRPTTSFVSRASASTPTVGPLVTSVLVHLGIVLMVAWAPLRTLASDGTEGEGQGSGEGTGQGSRFESDLVEVSLGGADDDAAGASQPGLPTPATDGAEDEPVEPEPAVASPPPDVAPEAPPVKPPSLLTIRRPRPVAPEPEAPPEAPAVASAEPAPPPPPPAMDASQDAPDASASAEADASPPSPPSGNGAEGADGTSDTAAPAAPANPVPSGGGLPRGVRDLGYAFTDTIPYAVSPDKTWAKVKAGTRLSITARIIVGPEGRIDSFKPLDEHPDRLMVRLVELVMFQLERGRFAVAASKVTPGEMTLEISARTSDEKVDEGDPVRLERSYDSQRRAGRAAFVQSSGRRVDVDVLVVKVETQGAPVEGDR